MTDYINDRFPLSERHQVALKNLNRVLKQQMAFIDVTDDIVVQMSKVKHIKSVVIKREVFQSRSNSNNFSNMTVSSKFKRPKNKKVGQVNLNEIREDASQLSDDYDQSSVMVILDWNKELKKCWEWAQSILP